MTTRMVQKVAGTRPAQRGWLTSRRLTTAMSLWLLYGTVAHGRAAEGVPASCRQLVVAIADDWEATTARLQRYERQHKKWVPVGERIPVLLGRRGLAWGRGEMPTLSQPRSKREGDRRAPAGIFTIGKVYGYAHALPAGSDFPYHRVGLGDAWVDDVNHPLYNQHVQVDPKNPPAWFEKQKMRHGDFAYEWLVEIRHNADPPVAGAGSAIFFHIRRGPTRTTSGCTTMKKADLEEMIRWLRSDANPHYVLLPRQEYEAKRRGWRLP